MKKRIGVLLSGRGSNFEALAESVAADRVPNAEIAVVISNREAGPIILQDTIPVLDEDTETSLSEKILKEEHRIYSEAVKIVLEGKYKIVGRRVLRSS